MGFIVAFSFETSNRRHTHFPIGSFCEFSGKSDSGRAGRRTRSSSTDPNPSFPLGMGSIGYFSRWSLRPTADRPDIRSIRASPCPKSGTSLPLGMGSIDYFEPLRQIDKSRPGVSCRIPRSARR